ncbi:MAG: hypothetical protein ABEK17_04295, partial [Candidatus Aenigmatarchaeota archaeon]
MEILNNLFSNKLLFGFVLVTLVLSLVSGSSIVLADHVADITIDPDVANCNELGNTFTVNIENSLCCNDSILQVEIYKSLTGLDEFDCGPAPTGWELLSYSDRCIYVTGLESTEKIEPGEDLDFTFNASMSSNACYSEFMVATVDDAYPTGDRDTKNLQVNIDCTDPEIIKTVGDPKETGDGFDWWITQDTLITVDAEDSTENDVCNLGLEYCQWRYRVDGGSWSSWDVYQEDSTPGINFDFDFEEDSVHDIEIECYDVAGNMEKITETDRVDDTNPITTNNFEGPQKSEGDVLWIDGITNVTLDSSDPDQTGEGCNIGVEETYYTNIVVDPYEQDVCMNPSSYCNANSIQGIVGDAKTKEDGGWNTYTEPFQKSPQGCHVLEYYSVDELGNEEDIKYDCFFVDKKPPYMEKDNGNTIHGTGETDFTTEDNSDGDFHWLTADMPITFTCDDTKDSNGDPIIYDGVQPVELHYPSEGEKLCFKVSYDEPSYPTDITQDYCENYGGDYNSQEGYCCVSVDSNKEFKFNFLEESKHKLEYYCKDAVEKETDIHTQYYKVDDTSPQINKTMLGIEGEDWSGDCPPQNQNDVCYVADNGVGGVHIEVEDPDTTGMGCAVDDIECTYTLFWYTDKVTCEGKYPSGWDEDTDTCIVKAEGFGDLGSTPPFDILFHEDSEHELYL